MGDESESVSEGQFSAWLTPAQARDATGLPQANAVREIVARLRGGLVTAAPAVMSWQARDGSPRQDQRKTIPPNWWRDNHDIPQTYDDFWVQGLAYVRIGRSSERTEIALFDVRIDPEGLKAIPKPSPPTVVRGGVRRIDYFADQREAASAPLPVTPAAPAVSKGGRPPKPFWEDALIDVARRWVSGELQPPPQRQADVERALADWIVTNGFEAGETQTKERAKKLWAAFKD